MPTEPGKYDAECAKIQQEQDAEGVLLIVIKGRRGSGFSAAATLDVITGIPAILRSVAEDIESQQTTISEQPPVQNHGLSN